ncbi:MAG: pseudouridine synthase [bacterium]
MSRKSKGTTNEGNPAGRTYRPSRAMGLSRALMKAGYGTRRQTDEIVQVGRVQVDKKTVFDPRSPVGPENEILLDNAPLLPVARRYYAIHKPLRVVCTAADGLGRKLVEAYFPKDVPGLQPVGRMDGRTTGLLLISNDSAWNNLINQSPGLEQEYRIQIEGYLSEPELAIISAGVHLPKTGLLKPESVKVVEELNNRCVLTLVIRDGKIRQVRKMFSTLRHKVTMLRRIRVGDIRLGDLSPGEMRPLQGKEVDHMRAVCRKSLGDDPRKE